MSKLVEISPYHWTLYEENGCTGLRIFGLDENNESCFILISDFYPYAYLELPSNINWTSALINSLSTRLDNIAESCRPIKKEYEKCKKLYFAKYNFLHFSYSFLIGLQLSAILSSRVDKEFINAEVQLIFDGSSRYA